MSRKKPSSGSRKGFSMKFLSHAAIATLLAVCVVARSSAADAKPVPPPPTAEEAKAPGVLGKDYKEAKPDLSKTGVFATANEVVVMITAGGGFGLAYDGSANGAVFEYQQKGYDTKLKYLTFQGGFLYFQVTEWQIIVAVRDSSPFDVWFFINGGPTPVKYANSASFYPIAK
jgi:hypothetical protein